MNMILCEMRCTHKCIQTSKFRLGIKVKTGITWTEVFCLKYPKPLTNTSERLRSTAEMSKTRGRRGGRAAGSEFRGKGGLSLYVPVYTSACVENWRGSWAVDPQRLLSNGEQTDSRKTSALIRTCLLHLPLFISQLHWWPGNWLWSGLKGTPVCQWKSRIYGTQLDLLPVLTVSHQGLF